MKRVGIVTHYGENYGGMLQAYALQRYVKDLGYECKIISNEFLYRATSSSRIKAKINNLKSFVKNPFSYMKRRKAMRAYVSERALKSAYFREFLKENIEIDRTGYNTYQEYLDNPPNYDVYLSGSDQIWNPNLYNKNGFYFSEFAPENATRISFASSVAVTTVTEEQGAFMKPHLEKMDIISTRETEGSKIVAKLSGKKVRTVIDPTLLLNGDQWSEVVSAPLVDRPYIFCYFFSERNYIAKVKKQVKDLTGLELVCIPYVAREMGGDDTKIFEAGPAEFISLIKNAELVLTDSFHATAFSINMKTPFLSLCRFKKSDTKSMNSRLNTILGLVGLEDRLIDENDKITKEMLFDVDLEKAHRLLDERRKEDAEFLKNAIEYCK
jgi:hypothetical protein